jgi:hypothetical protein
MKFSIITPYDGNARFLNWTAKSLALQMEANNFEWIVVHDEALDVSAALGENFPLVTIAVPAKAGFETAALNSAMETANGEYLWILPAGVCLADSNVLKNVSRELIHHLNPDCLYGMARIDGALKRPGNDLRFGPVTSLAAMLFRAKSLSDVRFSDAHRASDYLFMLQFFEKAQKIETVSRVLCDIPVAETHVEALQRCLDFAAIRREFVRLNPLYEMLIKTAQRVRLLVEYRLELIKRLVKADRARSA